MTRFPEFPFWDDARTPEKESLSDIARRSFSQAVDSLTAWSLAKEREYTWGNYKPARILHLLQLPSFSREFVPTGGGRSIVNANSGRHGVSFRIVTELQPRTKTWFIYPGGQSGNPGSPYYDNFIDLWKDGKYVEGWFMQSPGDFPEQVLFNQQLTPF